MKTPNVHEAAMQREWKARQARHLKSNIGFALFAGMFVLTLALIVVVSLYN